MIMSENEWRNYVGKEKGSRKGALKVFTGITS